MSEQKMVTITEERYNDLLESEMWEIALDQAGIDNWDGYEYARECYAEMKGEDN